MKRPHDFIREDLNGRSKRRAISQEETLHSFREGLFENTVRTKYETLYKASEPYKHGVIHNLLNPTLLRNVRDEIQTNISFTAKETDIYKIYQSGDLANLDGLEDRSLKLLPSLVKLRDALYSPSFRQYLSEVTGAGPLSGSKTDMAVNVYTPTCHLLCHDDVIGSRRVSYILYLTDPDTPWREEWGGALRLYPTIEKKDEDGSITKVPSSNFSKSIPPAFNQLSFFAVQPGESYHDVEEVYPPPREEDSNIGSGGRVRMAISGWFHIPQAGEEGYVQDAEAKQNASSSLAQLQSKADKYELPQPVVIDNGRDEAELTEQDLSFLLTFMNARYLTPDTVEELKETFAEESTLQLAMFLNDRYANTLKDSLLDEDCMAAPDQDWKVAVPPTKHRYLYYLAQAEQVRKDDAFRNIVDSLLPSPAFHTWLQLATGLELGHYQVLGRRFRRGQDYQLATPYEDEDAQLEICLNLTPSSGWGADALEPDVDDAEDEDKPAAKTKIENGANDGETEREASALAAMNEASSTKHDHISGIESAQDLTGLVGGYEVYMAGEDDEADETSSDHGVTIPSSHTGAGKRREKADPAIYQASGEDEDDGILLSTPPCWNNLTIVLRDSGTLKFVKYVSKAAPGDRWDVTANYKVNGTAADEDDE